MIDLLLWYGWLQIFGLGGWLIAARWLRNLPDRGYGASKALGLLLSGFAYWWIVTARLSSNNSGAVLLALAVVFGTGIGLWQLARRRSPETAREPLLVRPSWAVIIAVEALFAAGLVIWAVYRSYNPEIVEAGGEKFMEIMMLNAILRSPAFPPNDAWLSGFSISYYYFGYVLLAMLTRASGIASSIAFNLGNATFFALTLAGAFSLGYNLWAVRHVGKVGQVPNVPNVPNLPNVTNLTNLQPILAGLLTATMLAVMGNMGGLMESARCARVLPQGFWQWLDVRQIDAQQVECNGLAPTRFYWWWDWSRVVHDYTPDGGDQEVITEMPSFSFLLGDNHPHVMSLPFTLVAIAVALSLYRGNPHLTRDATAQDQSVSPLPSRRTLSVDWDGLLAPQNVALTAIVVGGLSFMNTWDFPVYGALVIGGVVLGRLLRREPALPALAFSALIAILGYMLYGPFYATFSSQASGIGINLFNATRWPQFLLMFAPFVVAGAGFVLLTTARFARATGTRWPVLLARAVGLAALTLVALLAGVVAIGLISPQLRGMFNEVVQDGGSVFGVTRDLALQRLGARLADPWVPVLLLGLAALCVVLILAALRLKPAPTMDRDNDPAAPQATPFVLLLFLGGALLTLAVEFIFLRDMFGTRMNTVFKFYYQAWTVWAVAGAFAIMALGSARTVWPKLVSGLACLLVVGGLFYPVFAVQSRTNNFAQQPTLDGAAHLNTGRPDDAQAIAWLNANVAGAPVIAEAPADHAAAYSYNGRISAFTGLPTLLGWGGHQNQWRGNYDEPARREPLIQTLFDSTDDDAARAVITEFNVQYVIVGPPERDRYSAEGLAKFERLGQPVFESGRTVIYRINPANQQP